MCLSDFEHSKQITDTSTIDENEMGDVRYKSPEVLVGIGCSEKSDVWSLGCVLYELLTGEVLFKSNDKKEIVFIVTIFIQFTKDLKILINSVS